jgi:hypothetical protein
LPENLPNELSSLFAIDDFHSILPSTQTTELAATSLCLTRAECAFALKRPALWHLIALENARKPMRAAFERHAKISVVASELRI